ncbi:hypothetical protein JHK84_040189 [Glycine max]|nr:hypothetical protein JHK86_039978 [Glycine max]KAG4965578.1 hypothetical protein JHK85_040553 [Glycine max]KAG5121849.1 hypothetical protein JHK84_040189 [Glycine max]
MYTFQDGYLGYTDSGGRNDLPLSSYATRLNAWKVELEGDADGMGINLKEDPTTLMEEQPLAQLMATHSGNNYLKWKTCRTRTMPNKNLTKRLNNNAPRQRCKKREVEERYLTTVMKAQERKEVIDNNWKSFMITWGRKSQADTISALASLSQMRLTKWWYHPY